MVLHTLWIILMVPWEPLTLLVVSLMLVNCLHHWSVIKQFSSMLDLSTSIHILEIVLWSVGIQDPIITLHKFGLSGLVCDSIHDSLIGWLRPYLSLSGQLRPYLSFYMVLPTGWLHPYHRPILFVFWMAATIAKYFWTAVTIPIFLYGLIN